MLRCPNLSPSTGSDVTVALQRWTRSPAVQHERDLLQGHAASVRQEDGGEHERQDGAAGEEEEGDVRAEVVIEVGEVAGHQEGDEPVVGRRH